MAAVKESQDETLARDPYEVVVVGGGLGGIAAAVAAARAGASTALLERNSFVGGVATAGMCCSIFNCYHTRDGRLGTTGISVEVADRLAEAEGYGRKWRGHKGHIIYDLERGKLQLTRLVRDAGAEMLLGVLAVGVVKDGDRVAGVIIEGKGGREVIRARTMVDASGDSDIAAHAGAAVRTVESGRHSLCFRMGGVDVDQFAGFFREHPDQYPGYMDVEWTVAEALAQYDDCGTLLFPHGGGIQMDAFKRARADGALPQSIGVHDTTDACQMHALRSSGIVHVVTGFVRFDGLDSRLISRSVVDGREMAHIVGDVYRRYIPGFRNAYVAGTAVNLGVRTSRHILGDFVFTAEMMGAGIRQPDVVGRAVGWDHPVRHHGAGAWGVQALRRDSFDLPYRCLLPRGAEGLVMGAGRSVSSEDPRLLRVMAHTMVVGQAAGTAAAVAARSGRTLRDLDVGAIQQELRRQGVDV
jgi:hypothetical protein